MTKRLLKFCASWCGKCRRVGDHGAELMDIDEGDNLQLAEYYDVQALPTFVETDSKGHTRTLVMPETDEEIEEWIKKGETND